MRTIFVSFHKITLFIIAYLIFCVKKNINHIFFVVLSAFGLAKLYGSQIVHKALKKLGADRTFHSNIWDDILLDGTAWIDVQNKETKEHYYGLISLMEDFGDKILIKRYSVYDENGKEVENYDYDPTQVMLIDTSKFNVIRIIYTDDHPRVKNEYALDSQHYISNRDRRD